MISRRTLAIQARYRELHGAGLSVQEIAAEVGVSAKAVRGWLRTHGLMEPAEPTTTVRYRALYEEGLSAEEIAEQVGVGIRSVRGWMYDNGLLEKRSRPYTPDEWAAIVVMLDEGVPSTWVAETFGRHPATLRKRYRRQEGRTVPAGKEFDKVWSAIRQNPQLRKYHNEFAPKTGGTGV